MSPEQARGESVDGRTDQFSLGSVMVAMLTGRPPFAATTTFATLRQVIEQPSLAVNQVRPDVPEALVHIIDRLLQKKADERFESTSELTRQLQGCLARQRRGDLPIAGTGADQDAVPGWLVITGMLVLIIGSLLWMNSWIRPAAPNPGRSRPGATTPRGVERLPTSLWLNDPSELGRCEAEVQAIQSRLARPWYESKQ